MKPSINHAILDEISSININRIYLSAFIAVPLNVAHILFFWFSFPSSSGDQYLWRLGIIMCHSAFAIIMSVLSAISYYIKQRDSMPPMTKFVEYTSILTLFAMGIFVVVIDQLMTVAITPFLVVCIIVGLVYLITPKLSAIFYGLAYLAYFFGLSITQTDQALLLTTRLNGLTVVCIGFFLSILLWKNTLSNLQQKQTISQQEQALIDKNRELEYLAYYDQMTGVYNRRRFEELLNRELSLMKRYVYPSCLVMLDIDNFKEINDAYGHPVGDEVLKKIATTLTKNLRETDILARWGGDEFLILLSHTQLKNGRKVVEHLRELIESLVLTASETPIKITSSAGVVELISDEAHAYENAYNRADAALYQAKKKGRNRVEVVENTTK